MGIRPKNSEFLKRALWAVSAKMLQAAMAPHRGQVFSIGIYRGSSPTNFADPPDIENPVLTQADVTDIPAAFVADPFMLRRDGRWYMFMEILNRITRRGVIGLAVSEDGAKWRYQRVVLEEPFHMAYPQILRDGRDIYMVPDTPGNGVRLYRATEFPHRWTFERTLNPEPTLFDSTLFRHHGRWWMLAGWVPEPGQPMSLRLFSAASLKGDWEEHPQSPIVRGNDSKSRPGGSVVSTGSQLFRMAQDGNPDYGMRVRAFEILELSRTSYRERSVEASVVVEAGAESWRCGGMHHVDAHPEPTGEWLACVDGWHRPSATP